MATISVKAADGAGEFSAYVAKPAAEKAGAVVVIQEIFGVNGSLRATCDQLAAMGFLAVAPDLFWRLEPGVDITDKTDAEWQKAFSLMQAFDQDKGVEDLRATLTLARALPGGNGRAGAIGFCLGGRLAVMMAERSDADVVVSYYGVGIDGLMGEIGQVRKPLLLHIAEQDEFVPAAARERVLAAVTGKPGISAHVYPGVGHAFARVGGVHYDARAATIANGRTAETLAAVLG